MTLFHYSFIISFAFNLLLFIILLSSLKGDTVRLDNSRNFIPCKAARIRNNHNKINKISTIMNKATLILHSFNQTTNIIIFST